MVTRFIDELLESVQGQDAASRERQREVSALPSAQVLSYWARKKITKTNFQKPREGGFSKGGLCTIQFHGQETKIPKNIGPSSTFGTQSAAAKRGVHFCKPPSKNPLFFVPQTFCFWVRILPDGVVP